MNAKRMIERIHGYTGRSRISPRTKIEKDHNVNSDSSTPNDSQDGTDTPTTEWFGQSVGSDTELAEELVDEHGEQKAEQMFDEQAKGEEVEQSRRGDSIDPELGEDAYRKSNPDHAAETN